MTTRDRAAIFMRVFLVAVIVDVVLGDVKLSAMLRLSEQRRWPVPSRVSFADTVSTFPIRLTKVRPVTSRTEPRRDSTEMDPPWTEGSLDFLLVGLALVPVPVPAVGSAFLVGIVKEDSKRDATEEHERADKEDEAGRVLVE